MRKGDRAEGAEALLDNVLKNNNSISNTKTTFGLDSRFRLLSLKLSRNESRKTIARAPLGLAQQPSPATILLDGMWLQCMQHQCIWYIHPHFVREALAVTRPPLHQCVIAAHSSHCLECSANFQTELSLDLTGVRKAMCRGDKSATGGAKNWIKLWKEVVILVKTINVPNLESLKMALAHLSIKKHLSFYL